MSKIDGKKESWMHVRDMLPLEDRNELLVEELRRMPALAPRAAMAERRRGEGDTLLQCRRLMIPASVPATLGLLPGDCTRSSFRKLAGTDAQVQFWVPRTP